MNDANCSRGMLVGAPNRAANHAQIIAKVLLEMICLNRHSGQFKHRSSFTASP
jgi:hypothetical protein